MGWIVVPFAALMFAMGVSVGSVAGAILSIIVVALTLPPLWRAMKGRGHKTYAGARWSGAIVLGFAAMLINGAAYSETPEGKAAEAERIAERKAKADRAAAEDAVEEAEAGKQKEEDISSGEHCLSGWDGSFPALKDTVKRHLRNPRSFDHVDTMRTPVDGKGKFGLVMTYRAENGFGGMNVEAIAAEVDAQSCDFREVSKSAIAKRLQS